MTEDQALPPEWAFVVQLRRGTALTPEGLAGRVEHVLSGQSTAFTSLEQIRAFIERVLSNGTGQHAGRRLRPRRL